MKTLLGSLAEGTLVKFYEGDSLVEFIVAKHDYLSTLNGKGHTLLVRTSPLTEKWPWAGYGNMDAPEELNWEYHATLRAQLESKYAEMLREEDRNRVKTLIIPYQYDSGVKNCEGSFFVLAAGDIVSSASYGDGDTLSETVQKTLAEKLGENLYWTRSTREDSYTDGDGTHTYEYGEVLTMKGGSKLSLSTEEEDTSSDGYVVPCFAVYDSGMALGDDGILQGVNLPEIEGEYFGTGAVYTKKSAFYLTYSVHHADGDAITVTEYLDGTEVRTYTAVDGAVNRFTVTQITFESLDDNVDHELRVTASDGVSTVAKACRIHKAVKTGYVVYIGKITGSADKTGYYWTEREVLHDPENEEMPFILEPELTLEANELGTFIFTMPGSNPHRDKLILKNTVISVEEDGNEIFMGYVTETTKNFDLDIEVTCEGELGFLQDRDCIIEEKTYTSTAMMCLALGFKEGTKFPSSIWGGITGIIIGSDGTITMPDTGTTEETPPTLIADSRFAEEGKIFNPGTVTKEKTGTSKDDKETKTVTDCWSAIKNYLVDKYGGYLRLRKTIKMENGVRVYRRYLDYLEDIPDKTDQTIRFGQNLLDVSYYLKANQIVNSVTVIGYQTTGFWIFTSTEEIRVKVERAESIKKYGLCQRILIVDGTSSTKESLTKKGNEELDKYDSQFSGSLTVSAADLADVGVDVDRLGFLKKTGVISEDHGLSNWLPCIKEVIPLDALEEKEFTFGGTSQKLSALQASNFGTAGKAWDAINSTIKYVKSGG